MGMHQSGGMDFCSILIILIVAIPSVIELIPYYKRRKLYKTDSETSESRERMKFITRYSPDEVVWKLRCHGAGDVFAYKVKKESDAVLLLTVTGVQCPFSRCAVEAKYKIAIKEEGEHTAIWVFLVEYSDEFIKERFGWEMKGFIIKKLDAENVEFDLGKKEPDSGT